MSNRASTPLLSRITTEDNLYTAWRRVRANQGGPGSDGVRLSHFEADLEVNLDDLRHRLTTESYVPLPLRRASIPKRSGDAFRELAIPTVADRVAQRAFVQVLEGVFEPLFLPCSFGYRTGRGVGDAVEMVLAYRSAGCDWIVDADVQDFFPSVDHGLLLEMLRDNIHDGAVLRTIALWLEAGALQPVGSGARQPLGAESQEGHMSLLRRTAATARTAAQALLLDAPADGIQGNWDALNRYNEGDTAAQSRLQQLAKEFGKEAIRLAWQNRRTLLPLVASKAAVAVGGGIGLAALVAIAAATAARSRHVTDANLPNSAGGTGTPQGGPISPLLANVYLHAFDQRLVRQERLRLVRYADDFVICCPSQGRARQARELAQSALAELRLQLHPGKTRIVSCADPLQFLGYAFDGDGAFPVPPAEPARSVASAQQTAGILAKGATQAAAAASRHTARVTRRSGVALHGLSDQIGERTRELRYETQDALRTERQAEKWNDKTHE